MGSSVTTGVDKGDECERSCVPGGETGGTKIRSQPSEAMAARTPIRCDVTDIVAADAIGGVGPRGAHFNSFTLPP